MTDSLDTRLDALRGSIDLARGRISSIAQRPVPDRLAPPFALVPEIAANPDAIAELIARASELGPWGQGPFHLGDTVLGAAAGDGRRWAELDPLLGAGVAGARALVVGGGAGYDAFALAARGAASVLAIEASDAIVQAELLRHAYGRSGVELRRIDWPALDPAADGPFDLIVCDRAINRTSEPVAMLRRLHAITTSAGKLVSTSWQLGLPEHSEYVRLTPGGHGGDREIRSIPGRLATRWMLHEAGFRLAHETGEWEGPRERFPVVISGAVAVRS